MQTKTTFKLLGAMFVSLILTACGGGDGSALDNMLNGSSISSSSSTSSAFAGNTSSNASAASSIDSLTFSNIGYGTGSAFVAQAIGVGIGTNTLSAGGETTLTVNLVSATGTLVTENLTVTFNSKCFAAKKAILSSVTVQTSSGEATTTYTAKGCVGNDLITATVNGKAQNAQTTLNIEADTIGSIKFIDATPTQISLTGTGGTETSTVRFQVLGSTGAPIENSPVDFVLSTTQGGLYLTIPQGETKPTGKTDASGYVSTKVNAGAVSTAVRITATTANTLSTQSSVLTVSTGIPDQNSMSLALTDLAPISWGYDGINSTASIRLADAFNNPVPDGTAVSFTTSGGSIQPSCITIDGTCSVKWTSQEPRPTSTTPFTVSSDLQIVCPGAEECRSGRVQLLATAIGNESFTDKNGNGRYDGPTTDEFSAPNNTKCNPNVPWSTAQVGVANSCDDLGEAYLDKNFNKMKDANEEFADFNVDGIFNPGNNIYNGVLCNSTDILICTKSSVTVRKDAKLVMASTDVYLASGRLPGQPIGKTSIAADDSVTISMLLADENGNGMPAGTIITTSTETASNITAKASPSTALGMSQEPTIMTLFLKAGDDPTKKPSGTVIVEITAPSILGKVTTTLSVPVCGPTTSTPVTVTNCN